MCKKPNPGYSVREKPHDEHNRKPVEVKQEPIVMDTTVAKCDHPNGRTVDAIVVGLVLGIIAAVIAYPTTWAIAVIAGVILHTIKERHAIDYESGKTPIGFFEFSLGLEGYEARDLDLTLSFHPQYVTIHISLWFVTFYVSWSMYGTHADCAEDMAKREETTYASLKTNLPYDVGAADELVDREHLDDGRSQS